MERRRLTALHLVPQPQESTMMVRSFAGGNHMAGGQGTKKAIWVIAGATMSNMRETRREAKLECDGGECA